MYVGYTAAQRRAEMVWRWSGMPAMLVLFRAMSRGHKCDLSHVGLMTVRTDLSKLFPLIKHPLIGPHHITTEMLQLLQIHKHLLQECVLVFDNEADIKAYFDLALN